MKILFLITKSNWGGAQRYVYDLATNIPKKHEVVVALGGTGARNAEAGTLSKKLGEKNIRTILVSSFMRDISVARDVRAFFEVLSLLRTEKPAVIHANSSKAGGIGMAAGFFARIPKRIFTVHGFAFSEDRSALTVLLIRLASWTTLLFATHAICVAKSDADIASHWLLVGKKVRHIPIGIAAFPLFTKEEARNALLPDGVSSDLWFGSIAELHPNKGLAHAIEACALLKSRGKIFIYVIIGAGEEETMLRTLIQKHRLEKYVYLVGYKPEAATYLHAFDIYVLSSKKEGMPYTLLEAGYAGSALVTSDIPSLLSVVKDNETALVAHMREHANKRHIVSLADTLERMLEKPELRTHIAELLKEAVDTKYSLNTMVENTLYLYS